MERSEIWYNDTFDPLSLLMVKISNFKKLKMADGRSVKKPLNCRFFAAVQVIFMKLGMMMHFDALNPTGI